MPLRHLSYTQKKETEKRPNYSHCKTAKSVIMNKPEALTLYGNYICMNYTQTNLTTNKRLLLGKLKMSKFTYRSNRNFIERLEILFE